jgi:two-component system response regulator FixJ
MNGASFVHVIDDNPLLVKAMQMILAYEGMKVRTYSSAQAFLDGPCEAGCVVTDVEMPQMTGLELIASMAQRGIRLPVIVASGDIEPPAIRRAFDCGAFDFLGKPFNAEALVAAVEKALYGGADGAEQRGRLGARP